MAGGVQIGYHAPEAAFLLHLAGAGSACADSDEPDFCFPVFPWVNPWPADPLTLWSPILPSASADEETETTMMATRGQQTLLLLAVCAAFLAPQTVHAQARSYPNEGYYTALGPFEDGDYATAAEVFEASGRSAVRGPGGRWIDSICYFTMQGECHYRMGNNAKALELYTAAAQLYVTQRNWLLQVEFPVQLGPIQRPPRPAISWGASRRGSRPAQIPQRLLITQGGFAAAVGNDAISIGSQAFSLDATEIMRCTALAMYRRYELMGHTCPHDPLTGQLVDVLSRRPAPPNHWSQAWVSTLLGIAYASAGKPVQATTELENSLIILQQYDHTLTPIALLTLGRVAMSQGQLDRATNSFYEATFPAAAYGQFSVISDAMAGAATAHMVSGQQGAYPPLVQVAAWARRNSRALEGSMYIAAAANLAHGGATNPAAAMIDQARTTLRRTEMSQGAAGARVAYLSALVNFQRGNLAAGNRDFQTAMLFQKKSSLRLFQTGLADQMYMNRVISDRIASNLYERYLSDPGASDWAFDPMETIAGVLNPHAAALEHWFEVAMTRKEHEKALEIADLIRRRRFYSALPMGGRLLSLRWVLEAPPEALGETALKQRRDILADYPAYAALSQRARQLRTALAARPIVTDDEEAQREHRALEASLADTAGKQELMLQAIALQRDAAEFAFPPKLDVKAMRKQLEQGQVVLAFYSTNRYVYAFMVSRDNYGHWQIEAPAKVRVKLKDLLKGMALHDRNQALPLKELSETKWKGDALELTQLLLSNTDPAAWNRFDELIVVPDGMLWYLPFEVLQLGEGESTTSLVDRVRIRYAPTVSLVQPDRRRMPPSAKTVIASGKLYPKDEDESVMEFAEQLRATTGGHVLPDKLKTPPVLIAKQAQRWIVADDVVDAERAPFGWSPVPAQKGKAGSTVGEWMALPWGGPQQVAVPGYHTAAENGLKRGGAGSEVFLTVCGVMASGTRTLLLSRWRVGGASTENLIGEFVQELPYQTASEAWQRSVELMRSGELDPTLEPRVQSGAPGEAAPASHPFFWSGYMLIDTGVDPAKPIAPAAAAK